MSNTRLLSVHTSDDLYLNGILSEPDHGSRTIIIHTHGMQGDLFSHMQLYVSKYPEYGVAFLSGENRGANIIRRFDTSTDGKIIGGAYEIFEECVYDIASWVDEAEELGYANIWISSHSLSPAKIAYYLYTTKDPRVKGVIFLSPSDNVGLVKDPIGAADHAICFPEALQLIQQGKPQQLLTHLLWGDKMLSARTYLNLFSDESAANVFHYYDPSRSWEVVESIRVPVIAFSGSEDDGILPVIDPQKGLEMLKNHLLKSPHVATHVFENATHSFAGFEEEIINLCVSFINS